MDRKTLITDQRGTRYATKKEERKLDSMERKNKKYNIIQMAFFAVVTLALEALILYLIIKK
jgi:hypothetical protein